MSEPAEREEALFEHALGLDSAEERDAYLREACGDDAALRERILGLLCAHDRAGKFLEAPNAGAQASQLEALPDLPGQTAHGAGLDPVEKPGSQIGRYKLLERIGEGGFGDVWLAEQEEPVRRQVALKIIKLGMDTRQVVARFEAERQALAMMDHPHIAKVFDGGSTGDADSPLSTPHSPLPVGRPYFVMELVRGLPFTRYCEERGLALRQRLELFGQVCRAVQHAHQKGIIHRDLKPSNILVTEQEGRPVPKVIDFGVAKAMEGRLTDKTLCTGFQQLLGTPTYMSPEQANLSSGGAGDVDTRSDIYALGVLLYELLTGSTPFDTQELLKEGYDQVLRTIREVDPQKPSTRLKQTRPSRGRGLIQPDLGNRQSEIAGDLDWIVLKCLEKDRNRRYETANALAMDIQRYLQDEPVVARPPTAWYRCHKFVRKHRAGVAVAAGFVALLAAATVGSMALAMWANQERGRAEQAEAKSLENETKAIGGLWEAYLAQARANRWTSRPGRRFDSLEALAKASAIRPSIELRNEAIACMTLPDLRPGRKLDAFIRTSSMTLDRAWERYARSDELGNITIRRVADDLELAQLPGPGVWAWWTEFSPDGRFLAGCYHASGQDFPNDFKVWNLEKRQVVLTVSNCWNDQVFSPDNRYWLFDRRDDGPALYDPETLQEVRRIETGPLSYPCSAFSRDGQLLAVPSLDDSDVRIIDVESGSLLRKLAHPGPVRDLDWHPKNRWLACPCSDGNIYLWDAGTGQLLHTFHNHQDKASQARFNHRGDLLLTSAWDSTVRLWDLSRAAQLVVMSVRRHLLQFSPDDRWAGLVERENQYALLEVNTAPEYRPLRLLLGKAEPIMKAGQISRDGRLLAAGSASGVGIWDLSNNDELGLIPAASVYSLAFLPDSSALVLCGDTGVFLWPLQVAGASREHLQVGPPRPLTPPGVFRSLSVTADGRRLAVLQYATAEDTYPVHNLVVALDSTNPPTVIQPLPNQGTAALSPDGRWLAAGIWRGQQVVILDAQTGERIRDLPVPESAFSPKFSPDGRWLVAGTAGSFHCWEVGTWLPVYQLQPSTVLTSQPSTATFSPDAKIIAVFHRYNRTHLIDAVRGRLLATLDLDRHMPLCFSPDAGALVMATENGQLNILDLRRIRQGLAALNLDWEMPPWPPPRAAAGPKRLVLTVRTSP